MSIEIAVDELRKTRLFSNLQDIDPDLSTRAVQFVTGIAPLLATIVKHFPFYTRHDSNHGYNVIQRIEQVVKPACLTPGDNLSLAPPEIFLLIAAAYAHDLGMTVFPGEEDALLKSLAIEKSPGWETNPCLQAHLRAEHSRRGGKYVEENAGALGLPLPLASALDKMMRAHNLGMTDLEKDLRIPYAAQAQEVDVLQLAVIVCMADALEFSDTRVIDGVFEKIALDPSKAARASYQENMKHICIGASLAIREDGSILVSGTFSDDQVLALAHRTFDEIEGWAQGYCDIDRRSKQPRLLVRPEPFTRNLVFTRGRFERLGVRLNKKNVINLIASHAVWRNNQGIAVRELVQNSVEACRYRSHHASQADAYMPAIRVVFDRDRRSITVSDNGCGMSERTVLNNLLTVGNSRCREPGYMETGYDPIARFGIGFWSVFTIAEHVHVETAEFEPHKGAPARAEAAQGFEFEVSLEELKDYSVFIPVHRPCGTIIDLKLRAEIIIDDVYAQGLAAILCSEIPLTFVLDGNEIRVPNAVPDVTVKDVLGERGRLMDEIGLRLFQWRGETDKVEISLGIAYRSENGKATFLADPSSSLLQKMSGMLHPKTSVCGFIAPVQIRTCIDLNRVGNVFANRKSPAGIEFSLDRQHLQSNQASLEFSQAITDLIHKGYRAFLDETGSRDVATIAALREQSEMHGGNVYDAFTGTKLMEATERYPDLLSFCLYPVFVDKKFGEVNPLHVDIEGLRRVLGAVWFIQRQPVGFSVQRYIQADSSRMLNIAYEAVRSNMIQGAISQPAYVMGADCLSSMLFDADPESSVLFRQIDTSTWLCTQYAQIDRIVFGKAPMNILAEVKGKWSGAVYSRVFDTPHGKPYLFLGRHRVLIKKSSALANQILDLAADNRKLEIAKLIADLQEDEQGYKPGAISHLL